MNRALNYFLLYLTLVVSIIRGFEIAFDGRSFLIDSERKLFIAGSFHYPRAPRSEWRDIFVSMRQQGLNLVQTYVFWDIHEPQRGVWNFPSDENSNEDLVAFARIAQEEGLYVHLRIAGYVCAEWNFGGMPVWLKSLNTTFRTLDDIWMEELSSFVEKTLSVVQDAKLLAGDGGPIIMLQIENEYGNMEPYYGENGKKYVEWVSQYALSLQVGGIPWVMCQQGEGVGTAPPKEIVNACNGYYCDNWIEKHARDFPDQPHMFTENWPGWFQNWGEPVPHRPAVDVSFSVARWFAKGGTYMNYYMAFGGTSWGRTVGGPLIVTSYDYDVQINEYTLRSEPKYSLLKGLHEVLVKYSGVLLGEMPSEPVPLAGSAACESHTYRSDSEGICLLFLSNWGERSPCSFPSKAASTEVPPWSVSLVLGSGPECSDTNVVLYNTKTSASTAAKENRLAADVLEDVTFEVVGTLPEPIGPFARDGFKAAGKQREEILSIYPLEQLSVTADSTDYLWYSTKVRVDEIPDLPQAQLSFTAGTDGGALMYVYLNGVLSGSTIGSAGGPPVVASSGYPTGSSPRGASLHVTLNVTIPVSTFDRMLRVDILSVTMGLKNYGPYLETIQAGIVSNVTLNGRVLEGWRHIVGLVGDGQGEYIKSYSKEAKLDCEKLCWYKLSFPTPASTVTIHTDGQKERAFTSRNFRGYNEGGIGEGVEGKSRLHLALDLGAPQALGKGMAFVNGKMMGRYWNVTAHATISQRDCADSCSSTDYVGSYDGDRCRTGCSEPSQRYYKLPYEWLVPPNSGLLNDLVVFDELGGSIEQIKLVEMRMEDLATAF